jgi:hypothetical protein
VVNNTVQERSRRVISSQEKSTGDRVYVASIGIQERSFE